MANSVELWNVIKCNDKEADFVLLNKSKTTISFSKRSNADLAMIMNEMEEASVPFSYTNGVKKIYFTLLRSNTHGDYSDGNIRLSCGRNSRDMYASTFVHELAHHLDEEEDISGRDSIITEKKRKARYLTDSYARKNVGEYIAVGFEVYYFGSRDERARMRKNNPKLWNVIRHIHRKYRDH